jgi:hypothetical protein
MQQLSQPLNPFGPGVDSFNRIEVVLRNRSVMPALDWFQQLGEAWPSCDGLWRYKVLLRAVLSGAAPEELGAMMTPEELSARAALPERVEVWRGCYSINRTGLSWTLGQEVAAKIVTLNRYRWSGIPILRRGTVRRDKLVLKLDRQEYEVISPNVRNIIELPCPGV